MDLYLTNEGDLAISPQGDLAITESPWRDDLQQAYIRVMTEQEDFLLYPQLGASLEQLRGMPQSPETGRLGEQFIRSALEREGRFINTPYSVHSVPTGPQSIRFDVEIVSSSREKIRFSIEQDLSL